MIDRLMHKLSTETQRAESDPVHGSAEKAANVHDATTQSESRDEHTDNEATAATTTTAASDDPHPPLQIANPSVHPRALKVLFLSSDTGGGHRASATSLAQQFTLLFPGSVYTLCDIVQLDGPPPYNTLVKMYKHLSAHPQQWKLVYNVSNTRAYEMVADVHMKSAMERAVRKRIQKYNPDVVVSVHPLMTNVPVLACSNLSKETGRHLPIFTVCTDLGSAHSMWFANGVEKLFVASEAIKQLAMQRGKVPEDKIIMSGLPIRNDFSVEATKMGDRHSTEGQVYQRFVRDGLGLKEYRDRKIVLVMGGGEGCGRLSHIVDALYLQFVERSIPAVILVVCGRNDVLKESLAKRDWEELRTRYMLARHKGADFDSCVGLLSDAGCIGDGGMGMAHHLRRIISSPSIMGGLSGGIGGGAVENAFSPTNAGGGGEGKGGHVKTYLANDGFATSLPGSRSSSPPTLEESVEVVTKSCAACENLYGLSSMITPLESCDEGEDCGASAPSTPVEKNVTPDTQPMSSSNSSDDDGDIEVLEESSVPLKGTDSGIVETQVKVIGLGFITKMAEYMVAADVLVSKAGPGTIAEAASLSLPVMLTSFLPGQEEGNVDYVIEGGFGAFVSDSDPQGISEEVVSWLVDSQRIEELSRNAKARGAPDAAAEIVDAIGQSALRWKNAAHGKGEETAVVAEEGSGEEVEATA